MSDGVDSAYMPPATAAQLNLPSLKTINGIKGNAVTGDASIDASGIPYSAGTTNSVDTDLKSKLSTESRSVMDFIPFAQKSAILAGTSTWDASTAINRAITELGGGIIRVPKGAMLGIASPIRLIKGAALIGDAPCSDTGNVAAGFILLPGSNCPMLQTPSAVANSASAATHFMGIENLLFNANGVNQTVETTAIEFWGAWIGSWIKNIFVRKAFGTSMSLDMGADVRVDHVWLLEQTSLLGAYSFDSNMSNAGTSARGGLLSMDHMFIEHAANARGVDDSIETNRGNLMRLQNWVAAYIGHVHLENGRRAIDLLSNQTISIGTVTTAYVGLSTDTDSGMVRMADSGNYVVKIGQFESNSSASGTKFVSLATSVQGSSNVAPYAMGSSPFGHTYSAINDITGIAPAVLAPQVVSNMSGVEQLGSYSKPSYYVYNVGRTTYGYLRSNGGNYLSIGSNVGQSSDKDFIKVYSTGTAGDLLLLSDPLTLGTRTGAGNIVAGAMWTASASFGAGVGLVYQRVTGSNTGADFVVTAQRGTAAPSVSATYIGQTFVDTTNKIGYMAISVGSGASDWKQVTN